MLFQKLQENVDMTNNLLQTQVQILDKKFLIDSHDKSYSICKNIVFLLLEYSEQTYQKLQIFNKYEFCVKFNFQ
jgi:hypothetical protein